MSKRLWVWVTVGIVAAVIVGIVAVSLGTQRPIPTRLLKYSPGMLVEEAYMMSDCAECHDPANFHDCATCHDDHGAIEMENVPFYAGLVLAGDVITPGYVLLDDILPYRDQPHTHLPLLDFLAAQGVTDFESVTLTSLDSGFVTISRENLTEEALLMPYVDGVRFAAENLHISAWLKGIRGVIVVGRETPLRINGQPTSMGRLLLGPTESVTVEQTDVMLKSEDDGQVRKAQTGARIEGVPLSALVPAPFTRLIVVDGGGQEHVLTADEAQGAVLAQLRGAVTLTLPARGRAQWISDVVEVSYE